MASKTFDQLTELAAAPSSGDWFALVDETAGSTKKLDAKYLVATAGVVTNVTGGGTIALGGFTATIPATGTVALLARANNFTTGQTITTSASDTGLRIVGGSGHNVMFDLEPVNFTPVFRMYSGGASINSHFRYGCGSGTSRLIFSHIDSGGGISGAATEVARFSDTNALLIGTNTDVTSARLQVGGTTGALLLSRLNTEQRNALTPTNGMILYNSSTNKFQGYEAGAWVNLI